MDRDDEIEALSEKLQQFYEEPFTRKIYYPHLQMPCCVNKDGVWYRARIEAHHSNCVVQVYLVDVGAYLKSDWSLLRALDDQFQTLPEGVSMCELVDIKPKNPKIGWGADVTIELKRLCKNAVLRAYVCAKKSGSVPIELYIVKKNVNYQINAYLAQNKFVEWNGDGEMIAERPNDTSTKLLNVSANISAIRKEASHREFRQLVKILDIESPSKFYVALVKYESAVKKMHTEIQKHLESEAVLDQKTCEWKVGNLCLVNAKLSKNTPQSWYRGRIETILDDNSFSVFLRDRGQIVTATLSDLTNIPSTFGGVIDGAIKCHLTNIQPTSPNWAKAAIDEFKYLTVNCDDCDIFSVSLYGEIKGNSLPVYLWGRMKPARADPLCGGTIGWTNINEVFSSKGYADCIENFKTIVDCDEIDTRMLQKEMTDFRQWEVDFIDAHDGKRNILCDDEDLLFEAELDPDHENFSTDTVVSWQPAKPIGKYSFNAYPTYVDNNAIIYLHEEMKDEYLRKIQLIANKHIGNGNVEFDESYKWKTNEPCLVRYHVDQLFYRGLIKKVLPNNHFKVEFVDYGNIEECQADELRTANILGNVPIQATKYYLAYIEPKSDNGIWHKKVLEFIQASIVCKLCNVRVEDRINDEYVPCIITAGSVALNRILVIEGLAQNTHDLNVKLNLSQTFSYYETENSKPRNRDKDNYKESCIRLDEFQEKISKKSEAKKEKEVFRKYDISADYVVEDSEYECVKENDASNSLLGSEMDEFEPLETSTRVSTAPTSFSLLPFTPVKLTKDLTKFECTIFQVLDSLHLFVVPQIPKYVEQFDDMEKRIKRFNAQSTHKSTKEFDLKKDDSCLARWSIDSKFYRAIILKTSNDKARVQFVDYLNEETVERKHIRKCPEEEISQPLKHLLVKLHGVKPNLRWRASDIESRLKDLIGHKVIAVIVRNNTIPSVHLFDSENEKVLVYQSLIDSNIFTSTKD